ncbi:VanW family protein [Alkaliphilus sp. MSJ-5]|uniref:VanW family protein n=1 Tax=Alkaliphilus flagellatus TaxID=2841507 RepID=A0ABS6G325_9FIRM|nr:VanW family protein [Alkaliphilus flagellatus]
MKNYILLILTVTLLIYSTSCNFKNAEKELEENPENLGAQVNISKTENHISNVDFDVPDKSGPILNVPWENDSKFKEAQEKHGTDVLLSAFCTVIKTTSPGEQHNVHLAAKSVSGIVVPPGGVFSQNNSIGPYVESKGYQEGSAYIGGNVTPSIGGGACKIASTLYNVSILSNLEIVERYNHSMPVHYLPYGQDSTVAYGFKDFKFKNTTNAPILIWAVPIENRVYMGFYGKEEPPKVEWHHNILDRKIAPKQYKINSNLKDGEEKVILEGMDGARVESFITIEYEDGRSEKKNLGISNYWPMPHIIEVNKIKH